MIIWNEIAAHVAKNNNMQGKPPKKLWNVGLLEDFKTKINQREQIQSFSWLSIANNI